MTALIRKNAKSKPATAQRSESGTPESNIERAKSVIVGRL
jgi:hypothetical protein